MTLPKGKPLSLGTCPVTVAVPNAQAEMARGWYQFWLTYMTAVTYNFFFFFFKQESIDIPIFT